MRWVGGCTRLVLYSKQQLVRLLDCETKARRAVVGTARSQRSSTSTSTSASERKHRPNRCGRTGFGWTAARESLPGHWRRLSIVLHCPHIYRHHTSHA